MHKKSKIGETSKEVHGQGQNGKESRNEWSYMPMAFYDAAIENCNIIATSCWMDLVLLSHWPRTAA